MMADPRHKTTDVDAIDYRTIANELFDCIRPHRSKPSLEVEVRLCQFTTECGPSRDKDDGNDKAQPNGLKFVDVNVTSSVSKKDFELVEARLQSELPNSTVSRSKTRDVTVSGWRYTYDMDDEKKHMRCIACVRKKRLFVKNILVSFGAYNLRFAVSTEMPGRLPDVGAAPKTGHTRLKDRLSVTDGPFRYDLTRVTEGGATVHEVELEAVLTSSEQLTESLLENLLQRAVKLATLQSEK